MSKFVKDCILGVLGSVSVVSACCFVLFLAISAEDSRLWWLPPVLGCVCFLLSVGSFALALGLYERWSARPRIEYTDKYIIIRNCSEVRIPIEERKVSNFYEALKSIEK